MTMALTHKDLWVQAYLALLHRYDPADAIEHADNALALSDERWKEPVVEGVARLVADKPFGAADFNRCAKVRD